MKETISKLSRLARVCGHLALDAEKTQKGSGEYYRGKSAGYIAAARTLKEAA